MKISYLLLLTLFIYSCTNPKSDNSGLVPASWVKSRVEDSKERLQSTETGNLIWRSVEAHGGLERWFSNGALRFHFDYQPLGGGTRRNTYQVVDQWSSRATHELADNRNVKFGWDGTHAWVYPDTAKVPVNPRFWSTTPFYFVGLPFVLADEGVILESLGTSSFNGRTYDLVKASYEAGTGDAPDDFYVVYIDQKTHLLGALRYIVSYPAFNPDGGHSPEKIMEITGLQTVKGVILPSGYKTYWWKEDQAGEHITTIDVTEVDFDPSIDQSYFKMPEGARIKDGL